MIQIYHLTKTYPSGVMVFSDATFSAPDSSFVVLSGGNRSGKSTLLKLLCGEESPTSGLMLVEGRPVPGPTSAGRNKYIQSLGLIFPDLGLLWERTIEDNLLLSLHLREEFRAEARQRALGLLQRMGLKGKEDKKPADLSFGEQRAVVLIRALVSRPKILLADEPFQGLDAVAIETALQILTEMRREGMSVILAVQDTAPIARFVQAHPDLEVAWARMEDRKILPGEAPPC